MPLDYDPHVRTHSLSFTSFLKSPISTIYPSTHTDLYAIAIARCEYTLKFWKRHSKVAK